MGRYKYGMRHRGFAPGCQPRGVVDHEDGSGRYFDFIYYDRRLTDAEEHDYELDYLGGRGMTNEGVRNVIHWLCDERNSHNCSECFYNHGNDDWQGRLPCGQFHCWVDMHTKEDER